MDAVTFQSEVLRIERLLYHVAYTALGNRQECADAVQEALLRAWKKRGSLRSQEHFKAWMVRILLNTIADGKRRGKLPTTELSDTLPAEERPDNLPLYEALRALLCEELEAASYPVRRKQLIERSAARLGERVESRADLRPGSAVVRGKSRLGMLLTELIHSGVISEDAVGYLRVVPGQVCGVSPARVRDFVLAELKKDGLLGKQAIFARAEHHFGTDKTASKADDNALRSITGRVLLELEREQHILKTSRGYRLADDAGYPGTELGSWLRQGYYVLTGKVVDEGAVTGGSDDGGIDGVIHTQDDLGYRETVLMQMKNRHAVMTSKDVREFYGAVCAENGSRGIFITLSSFHPDAQKLLDKVDNLTGMDGDKLFEIAKKCRYGLTEQDGRWRIDDALLLAE